MAVSDAQRREVLDAQVSKAISRGYRVESRSDFQAVVVKGQRPNHVLHLILSLVTLGIWLIVWLLVAIFAGEKRKVIRVDESGVVER